MIDFLIWQGHAWNDIERYTLRQLDLFTRKASDRLKAMHGGENGRGGRGTPRF